MTSSTNHCPVCDNPANISQLADPYKYDCAKITCPRCGSYALSETDEVSRWLKELTAIQIKTYALDPVPPTSN